MINYDIYSNNFRRGNKQIRMIVSNQCERQVN